MLLYQDITQALTPEESEAVRHLQAAALHMDLGAWNQMLKDPIIQNLLEKKVLQIGNQECKL